MKVLMKESRTMTRRAAELTLLLVLCAGAALAGTKEIRMQLMMEPELDLNGSEKIYVGPVLIEPRGDDPASTLDMSAAREFDGYLRTLLRRRTSLKILKGDESLSAPTDDSLQLVKMTDFWKELGRTTGADLIVAATIDVRVLDRAGYTTEEYVSPADGKTYFRQVLVEETGFKFDVLMLVVDAKTGELVFQEQISDFKERSERKLDAYTDMFDDLFNLENRMIGVFVPRTVVAKRTLYSD
jgi:hypothetical protein